MVVQNNSSSDSIDHRLLQAIPVAAYTCNAEGRITQYNKAACLLWGYEPDLSISWNGAWKLFDEAGRALLPEHCATAVLLRSKTPVPDSEIIVERPDASRIFVTERPQLVVDGHGNITGSVTVLTDTTAQKQREQINANLEAIFESTEDAVISKTLDGIITSWNPGAERILGYTATEMIGQSIAKIIPADRIDEEPSIIQRIIKGERIEHFDTLRQTKNGNLIDISLTISPLKDRTGKIIGASKIARDITAQKGLNKALVKSEQRFRHMVMQSSIAMLVMRGPEFIVEIANSAYLEIVDRKANDFIGRPLLKGLPELEGQGIREILTNVLQTGVPFYGNEFPVQLVRNGKEEKAYFNFSYQPAYEMDGTISGIHVVAFEVTSLVRSKYTLEQSESNFRNMVMQSPIAMTIFRGPDHIIEMANVEMFKNVWRKQESEVIGRKLLDVFPELKEQKYPELLKKVLTTGTPHREYESLAYVQGDDGMKKFYLDYEYSPLKETDGTVSGIMITVNNVTARVEAVRQLADAEERMRLAADGTGLATWDLDVNTREVIYSPKLAVLFGFDETKLLTHAQMRSMFHPEDRENIIEKAFAVALQTSQYAYEARVIWPDNSIKWVRTLGKVLFDDQHKPVRMLGTMRDITNEKIAQRAIEESEQRLNLAIDAAELGTWELHLKTYQLIYSNRYAKMFGLDDENLPHSTFLRFMHPDDLSIRKAAFEFAYETGILDYEARIIREDKSIRWIKAKGKLFRNDQTEPERMLGTIPDITDIKSIEEELEKRVKLRTAELQQVNLKLQQSNQELEQYAYVASHDLQEPLRKIRTYSGLLYQNLSGKTETDSLNKLEKIISSAERMSTLIYDLLNFSRLLKPETSFVSIDLNVILKNVVNDLELLIQQKKAQLNFDQLPILEGIPLQMGQLFYNLVNNSLKFSKPEESPVINITCKVLSRERVSENKKLNVELDYFEIDIQDNGIGFNQESAEQIFEVFKRLHSKTAYPGSGIGLALCRKIALNHQGDIHAVSEEGKGATFRLVLPARQLKVMV
jgi:PAS domain S-box-containing protein